MPYTYPLGDSMKETNFNEELAVVVLPDVPLLPDTNVNLKVGKEAGSEIYNRVKDDDSYGIALAIKEMNPVGFYEESDFYRVGTIIHIQDVEEVKDFYQIKAQILERVEVKEFLPDGDNYRATYTSMKVFLLRPILSCLKITGPGDVSFTIAAVMISMGDVRIIPEIARTISKNLFRVLLK